MISLDRPIHHESKAQQHIIGRRIYATKKQTCHDNASVSSFQRVMKRDNQNIYELQQTMVIDELKSLFAKYESTHRSSSSQRTSQILISKLSGRSRESDTL